jgi:galactonate dehydratase
MRSAFPPYALLQSHGDRHDDITWKDDIVTVPPVIENGDLLLPTGTGWGADVNEAFVNAHPPKR